MPRRHENHHQYLMELHHAPTHSSFAYQLNKFNFQGGRRREAGDGGGEGWGFKGEVSSILFGT